MLIALWHDLSDVWLAEALDDRAEPGREDAEMGLISTICRGRWQHAIATGAVALFRSATPSLHKTTALAGRAYRPATTLPIGAEAL
jgi:hypothetical protein